MIRSGARSALRQYKQVNVNAALEEATPHQLVQMLFDGALARIAAAIGMMEQQEIAGKGKAITHAASIIGGLRATLNRDIGGELVDNMDSLYEYMERRLTEANLKNDVEILREVSGLLKELKEGWDAIPNEYRLQRN